MELIADDFVWGSYCTYLTGRLSTGTHLVTIMSRNWGLSWLSISWVLNRTVETNPPAKLFKIIFRNYGEQLLQVNMVLRTSLPCTSLPTSIHLPLPPNLPQRDQQPEPEQWHMHRFQKSDDSNEDNDSDNTVLEIKNDGLKNDSTHTIDVDSLTGTGGCDVKHLRTQNWINAVFMNIWTRTTH